MLACRIERARVYWAQQADVETNQQLREERAFAMDWPVLGESAAIAWSLDRPDLSETRKNLLNIGSSLEKQLFQDGLVHHLEDPKWRQFFRFSVSGAIKPLKFQRLFPLCSASGRGDAARRRPHQKNEEEWQDHGQGDPAWTIPFFLFVSPQYKSLYFSLFLCFIIW